MGILSKNKLNRSEWLKGCLHRLFSNAALAHIHLPEAEVLPGRKGGEGEGWRLAQSSNVRTLRSLPATQYLHLKKRMTCLIGSTPANDGRGWPGKQQGCIK